MKPFKVIVKDIIGKNKSILSAQCKNCGSQKGLNFIEIDNYGNPIHICNDCLERRGKKASEVKHYN